MWVGEKPGKEEAASGTPFVGRTGDELARFLNGYQLPEREQVFLTNLVRELPAGKDVTQEEIERDAPELWAEIEEVQPQVIVALGRLAARFFLGDVDMEMVHGIPMPAHGDAGYFDSLDRAPVIFPTYHPAASFHSPELGALFTYDMQRLSAFLKGTLPKPIQDQWIGREQYTLGLPEPCSLTHVVAIDTEGLPGKPWGLSLSDMPGEAYVVKADRRDLIATLREALCRASE